MSRYGAMAVREVAEVGRTHLSSPYRLCPDRTKRNNGGHKDGKFRPNSGSRPPDLRTFVPICSVSQSGVVSRQREDSRDLNRVRSRPRYVRPTFEVSRTGVLSTADQW